MRWLLPVALTVQFMVALDMSVVNVALPDMRADLGFTPQGLLWVVNAYALAFGGLLMLGGRLADLLGSRPVLIGGLVLFGAASLVEAGSPGRRACCWPRGRCRGSAPQRSPRWPSR